MKSRIMKRVINVSGGTSEPLGVVENIGEEWNTDLSKIQVDDGSMPDCTGRERVCMKLKKELKIATWNVRSMSAGKLDNIIKEVQNNSIDILGIAEHRWSGVGHFNPTAGGKMIYSGREKRGQSGVGIYLNQMVTKSLLGYHPVNDRILSVRIHGKVREITIIQAYAPTSSATEEEREQFYYQLQSHMDKYKKDIMILIGDFNAKVGKRQNDEERGTIGDFTIGERNDNGEELVNFAMENELAIMNTMFQKHPRRLVTWVSPDGKTKKQIDFIMVQRRWKSAISDTQTILSADCDSDHELLKANFKLKLKSNKHEQRPTRYDTTNLSEDYCIKVRNKFSVLCSITEEKTPDELANEARDVFKEMAKSLQPGKQKKQKWISNETLQKIDERKAAKKRGLYEEVYKKIAKEVKQLTRRDKKKYIEDRCEEIERNLSKNRNREAYNIIKDMTKTFQPKLGIIKDENGTVLTESSQILDRWQRYCKDMFTDSSAQTERKNNVIINMEQEPLRSEVEWAIKSLKDGKSPGCDEITAEMIKASGDPGIGYYHKVCLEIWKTGEWPIDWKRSVFIILPKKGDLKHCSNHRTISLISHASKIILKIIMKRLEAISKTEVSKTQAGFRKERGTRDHIFNLRTIIEKFREIDGNLHICFIDYSKAFDCVLHEQLWSTLKSMGVHPNITRLIEGLYIGQQAAVRLECGTSSWFPVCKGVRQGCILSPHLFSLYTESIMREVEHDPRSNLYGEPNIQGLKLRDLRYADDTALLSTTTEGLNQLIHSVKEHSEQKGLFLNVKKTKIVDIDGCDEESDIKINGEKIECLDNFEYLGSKIEGNSKCSTEIRRRLAMAISQLKKMEKLWKGQCRQTKLKIVRACIFPRVTYGCEGWTISKSCEKRINSFELKCYRKMLRIPWTARRRNEDILRELNIKPNWLLNTIKSRKLTYCGHLKRHDTFEKHILEAKLQGKRRKGRPARKWTDDIKEWLSIDVVQAGR